MPGASSDRYSVGFEGLRQSNRSFAGWGTDADFMQTDSTAFPDRFNECRQGERLAGTG